MLLTSAPDITTMFDPRSPQAVAVRDLFNFSFVILVAILVLVSGLLIYIVRRFGARSGSTGEPEQVHGNTPMEIGWTLVPLGIVTLLTILMARTMLETHREPVDQKPDIIVTGHQWWWEVEYPASGLKTANEVHVPVGKRMLVQLEAADVIHDFWVPQLGPKQDMLPGQDNFIYLEPSEVGTYRGTCAEFCGNEHAWMRILVQADPPDVFDAWQTREAAAFHADSKATPLSDDAQKGAQVFAELTCINCHKGPDMVSDKDVGPDLTWLGDRQTLGAGAVAQNTREHLAAWLLDPQQFKPQCNMPNFHLTQDQVQALVAYLWRKSE